MANIIYDGGSASQAQNLITFTDFPNILRVDDNVTLSKAYIDIEIHGNLKSITTGDSQWHITLFGDTISNVMNPQNAINKTFCVLDNGTSTAASIVRALRNCPNIIANFTVHNNSNTVTLEARDNGGLLSQGFYETNISSNYVEWDYEDGDGSTLQGCLIDLDIYNGNDFVTTLEKTFYGTSCEFNVSPILTTLAKYGETVPYRFKINTINKDGAFSQLGYTSDNYITYGYLCNQGLGLLQLDGSNPILAQNVVRGENRGYSNNTKLYTYFPNIHFSYFVSGGSSPNMTVTYLDSAMNTIHTTTTVYFHVLNTDQRLHDISIDLDTTYFNQAFYVVLEFGSYSLLYEVIKPLKATEGAQRIYWRNSYGGISFLDFTGPRSETRNLENTTYQENIYDAVKATITEYRNGNLVTLPYSELTKVYNTKVDYKVTLKSHLFEEDGKWIYNDLVQSSKVWTEVNGNFYEIILDSVSVEEQQNNNIYEATIKYAYSQVPSEIQ